MHVFLNNKPVSIIKEIPIQSFLTEIKIFDLEGMAIAINETVIPKTEWENFLLKDNDAVLLIKATAGG